MHRSAAPLASADHLQQGRRDATVWARMTSEGDQFTDGNLGG
jgi:hypothetical protein